MFDFFPFALFFGELISTTNGHYCWISEMILCSFHGRLWLAEGCHRVTVATGHAALLVLTPVSPFPSGKFTEVCIPPGEPRSCLNNLKPVPRLPVLVLSHPLSCKPKSS